MGFQDTFYSLSDPIRRQIIMMLRDGKMSAGDIALKLDMTPAAVSYHLKKLKAADLIYETKFKNYIYYELNLSILDEVFMWFNQLKGGENQNEKNKNNL